MRILRENVGQGRARKFTTLVPSITKQKGVRDRGMQTGE